MSKIQNSLDKRAKELCAQLGALNLQKKQVDKKISDIEASLSAINQIAPDLIKIEQEIKKENNLENKS